MSLQPLKLPAIDTRLIKHDNKVYKLRLIYQCAASCNHSHSHGDGQLHEQFSDASIQEEIEKIIRVVLHCVRHDTPMCKVQTEHFLVNCACKPWPAANLLVFEQNQRQLEAHGNMLVLTLITKAKESVAAAVGQRDRERVATSSRGGMMPSDVHKRKGGTALQITRGYDGASVGGTVRGTSDNTSQQQASNALEVSTTTSSGRHANRAARQFTESDSSALRPTRKRQAQTKCGVATRSGVSQKSLPKSTQADSLSPSRRHTSKNTRHPHNRQCDGKMSLRQTRSQQCLSSQTKGGASLQQHMDEGVAHELCRHPLRTRPVRHRRDIQGNSAFIQHEELREELKLQHFAKPSSAKCAPLSPARAQRRESLLKRRVYAALDVIMTPVKKMFRSDSEVYEKPQK